MHITIENNELYDDIANRLKEVRKGGESMEPKEKLHTKKITLILDEGLEVQLQQQAERMGITRTELINIILYDYFQNIVQE